MQQVHWPPRERRQNGVQVFNRVVAITTLNGCPLKLVGNFTTSTVATESDVNMPLAKAWTAIDWLSIIWISYLSNKIKQNFFEASAVLVLRGYWWNVEGKKLDGNSARTLLAIMNKSCKHHPMKQQLHDHLPPISKIIQVVRKRHARHCWRSNDEHISDILRWTPSDGRANIGWLARTYLQQLCADRGCNLEGLAGAIDDIDW